MIGATLNGYIQRHIPCLFFILLDIDRLLEIAAGDHIVRNTGILGNGTEQNTAIKGAAIDQSAAARSFAGCLQCEILSDDISCWFIPFAPFRNGNSATVDLHRSTEQNSRVGRIAVGIAFQIQPAAVQCQLCIPCDIDQLHIAPRHVVHTDDLAAALGVINDQFARHKSDKIGSADT